MRTLKGKAADFAAKIQKDEDFDHVRDELKTMSLLEQKPAPKPAVEAAPAPQTPEAKK
jgi:hypothetical protein